MTLRKMNKLGVFSVATALALAGGAAGVVAAGNGTTSLDAEKAISGDSLGALKAGEPVTLSARDARTVRAAPVADYGLDLNAARSVPGPRGDGDWTLVPGKAGVCFLKADGMLGCASSSSFTEGGAFTTIEPVSDSERQIDLSSIESGKPFKVPAEEADGPGSIQGVVPNGITQVSVLDSDGSVIAKGAVSSNLYEVRIADFSKAKEIALFGSDGSKLSIALDAE